MTLELTVRIRADLLHAPHPWRSAIWGIGFLATVTMLIAALI